LGAKVEPWLTEVLERVEHALVHALRHEQRSNGDVAARERLRDRDQVGLEVPVLEREQLPRASEAGLHLVDREERPYVRQSSCAATRKPSGAR
jgi:hypothetical protein